MYSKRLYEPMNFSVRKVMYSMKYLFTSDQPDSIHIKIVQIAKKYNGYIVEQTNGMSTIRIPSKNQIEALSTIEGMGKVSKKELSGKDVTEEYEDLNIKLETLEKARKRYLELLDKAEDVKATLEVEKELERVNKEIDLLKGKLTSMTHLIEYITIEVRTEKTVRPGPLGWIFYGVYKGIAWLFVWE
ncbi:MAG: DUF4349 domain-containing protein [Candidatus Thermoplasmatota archaeon]|nr:DUF4349 domain-containing protein [Candidatus Thermoplasmatota archaeon]